jgi:hypothetical protein
MGLAELDRLLALWVAKLARIDDALLALEADTAHVLLRGARDAGLDDLYERRATFGEALEKAQALRRTISSLAFWEHPARTKEILALFATPPAVDLAAMELACTRASEAAHGVKRAWESLDTIFDAADHRLAEIARLADALDEPRTTHDEIAVLLRVLERGRRDVIQDPLPLEAEIAKTLTPAIDALERRLAQRRSARDQVRSELLRASALREAMPLARAEAVAAARDMRRDFVPDARTPALVAEDAVRALDAHWTDFEALAKACRWELAAAGLARFIETAERHIEQDRAVVAAFEAARARHGELESRLITRRAQASELAARAISEPRDRERQDEEARDVLALLGARPAALVEIEARIDAYEQNVMALARRARGGGR